MSEWTRQRQQLYLLQKHKVLIAHGKLQFSLCSFLHFLCASSSFFVKIHFKLLLFSKLFHDIITQPERTNRNSQLKRNVLILRRRQDCSVLIISYKFCFRNFAHTTWTHSLCSIIFVSYLISLSLSLALFQSITYIYTSIIFFFAGCRMKLKLQKNVEKKTSIIMIYMCSRLNNRQAAVYLNCLIFFILSLSCFVQKKILRIFKQNLSGRNYPQSTWNAQSAFDMCIYSKLIIRNRCFDAC